MSRPLPPADYPGCPATVTAAVAEGRPLRSPAWGLWDVTWAAIAAVLIGAATATLLALLDAPVWAVVLVGTTAPWLAMLGWPLVVTARRGNGPRIDLGLRLTWSDVGWGALTGAAGLVAAGIAAMLSLLLNPDLTSTAAEAAKELTSATGPDSGTGRLAVAAFALIVMVGAPIAEETFFRGLLFGSLRKRGLNAAWTVVGSGVLFALFHFEPTRFFVLLPTGVLLGWVRWKTGSTGASMVAHGLVNAPGAILLLVGLPGVTP